MHYAGDVVKPPLANRIDGMTAFQYGITVYLIFIIYVQPHDVAAVCHQIDGAFIAQTENTVHNFVFDVLDGARVGTFVNEGFYFLFGNRAAGRFDVQYFDNTLRSCAKQPDERGYRPPEHLHLKCEDHSLLFGNGKSNTFGYQFAKIQGQEGDDNDHDKDG